MPSTETWMPRIDPHCCIGCRRCVKLCPTHALAQRDGKAILAYPERCTYCMVCEDICPTMAIELPFLITITTKAEGDTK